MTKKILIFLIFLPQLLNAQITYSTLDSLAVVLSKAQQTANWITVSISGQNSVISFPELSFGIYSHNLLAYNVKYFTNENKEYILLTEAIDFSKATSLRIVEEKDYCKVVTTFTEHMPASTIYHNGNIIEEKSVSTLEIFCKQLMIRGAEIKKQDEVFLTIAFLSNKLKEENGWLPKGTAETLNKKWIELLNTEYPSSIDAFEVFIKNNKNSIFFDEASAILQKVKNRRLFEQEKKREALAGINNAESLMLMGHSSLKSYPYYYQVDTLTTRLLKTYREEVIGKDYMSALLQLQTESRERYKWNKEYSKNIEKIRLYDQLVHESKELNILLDKKINRQLNFSIFPQAALTSLGGMAVLTGAASLLIEDTFTPKTTKDLLTYGSGGFAVGLTWIILQGNSQKRTAKLLKAKNKTIEQLKIEIGQILEKRNQTYMGKPLINK
jgi:hypothetical protein